jgi:xylose dehydrogenase (NAD/NADP)
MSVQEFVTEFEARDWQTVDEGTLRLALVGLGWWTVDQAIPAIDSSELCETTVLVSSSAEKGERVASRTETDAVGLTYDGFRAGDAADEYDAVYVCTPNALHLPYARTAAELGKHVLCEKPMEASVERAEAMVDVCEEHGVELVVGYRMQTEPAVRRARELVADGAIGDPQYAHGTNTQRLLDMIDDPDQWRLDPELTGYGTSVMDLGIYPINTVRFLLDADPVSAQATMRSTHEAFADVPDEHAAFVLEYEGGVLATNTASQNAHAGTHLEIVGTEGRIRLDPAFHMETELTLTVGDRTVEFDTPQVDQMTEIFDYFANAVLGDAAVTPDGEHGLYDVRTIEAIHAAADSGRRVDVRDR